MLFCTTQNRSGLVNCNTTFFNNLDMVTPFSKQETAKEDMFQLKTETLPYIIDDSEFRKFSFKINITIPLFMFEVCKHFDIDLSNYTRNYTVNYTWNYNGSDIEQNHNGNHTGNTTEITIEWHHICNWTDCSHGMYLDSK